jgi:hypothetical protein
MLARIRMPYIILALAVTMAFAMAAQAHHGWRWTKGGKFEITGVVGSAKLGNPHGVVMLNVEGELWTVEVGQPWRNRRAGLTDASFAKGTELKIIGERSAKESERVVKAIRIVIKGKNHDLYPERL